MKVTGGNQAGGGGHSPSGRGNPSGGDGNPRGGGGNRSVATRGLASLGSGLKAGPKNTGSKSKNKQRNLGSLKDLVGLEDDDLSPSMPDAPVEMSANGVEPMSAFERLTGFVPTPAPENDPNYSHPEGVQSMAARREYANRYNRAKGIGKFSGRNLDYGRKVPDHILQGLSPQQRRATAELISPRRHYGNKIGNFLSRAFGQNYARAQLTIDDAGQIAYEENIDPAGGAIGQIVRGLTGSQLLGSVAGQAVSGHVGSISKTTSAEQVDKRADANRASIERAGAGVGQENNRSLFDRAAQQLYPIIQNEEYLPNLGIGVSQGKSRVRKAPKLSTLKARRANFGRVR
ncbi:hypothetical protein [Kiloniella majae]|uniref:hypothetical protein n=1 Tax=Kiloniella majae TaxID=1938558 RepID=UPI00117AAABB|nr:hypothetical protein [Kiloniella majae]